MTTLFCCTNVQAYKSRKLDHEIKFENFMEWAQYPRTSSTASGPKSDKEQSLSVHEAWPYAIQLVRQVNYGALEWTRYFVPNDDQGSKTSFFEITEQNLVDANFQKVNSYKNFKCGNHNKFFELNLYQKDPINRHHWRANIARPSADIDLKPNTSEQAQGINTAKDDAPNVQLRQASAEGGSVTGSDKEVEKTAAAEASRFDAPSIAAALLELQLQDSVRKTYADESDSYNYYYSPPESPRDLTACDRECGYCGKCDY